MCSYLDTRPSGLLAPCAYVSPRAKLTLFDTVPQGRKRIVSFLNGIMLISCTSYMGIDTSFDMFSFGG